MKYIRCSYCLTLIKCKHYKIHMKYNHKGADIIYHCSVESCNRPFNDLKCLRNHFVSHETDREISISETDFGTLGTTSEVNDEADHHWNDKVLPNDVDRIDECHNIDLKCQDVATAPPSDALAKEAISIVSEFYSDPNLSRIQVQRIVNRFNMLLNSSSINFLKSQVLTLIDDTAKEGIVKQFDQLQYMFSSLNTEHKRLKHLELNEFFIQPREIILGYVEEKNRSQLLDNIKITCQFIPLGKVLAAFFGAPNVLNETLDYISSLQYSNDVPLSNIIQTIFWKRKIDTYAADSIVLPLFLYEDDFETGNPLGSHATIHKLAGLYVSVACLPPKYSSKLNNIFLFQLVHSDDAKITPKERLYVNVIEEFNSLATEGVKIDFPEKTCIIYFKLALIIGDNLGLNTTLGYTQSFSSNYFCRICTASKNETRTMCVEDKTMIRTIANYEAALINGSMGIKERCAWNKVKDYHVAENAVADALHDELEGTCRYHTGYTLHNWIIIKKLFTLDTLNYKLKYFKYPDDCNPPPAISLQNIKSRNIRMSASEMKCFILNAGLIFGDLIPEGNLEWELYKLLRQILVISLAPSCTPESCDLLETLIEEHHTLFIQLFGNLKPKHHFMIHYPRIMNTVGPLRHLWTMRFEGKHQLFKNTAGVTRNRINLCRTLAIKHQLHLNGLFLKGIIFKNITDCRDTCNNKPIPPTAQSCLPKDFTQYKCIKYVVLDNVKYQTGRTVVTQYDEFPVFGTITHIFRRKNNDDQLSYAHFSILVEIYDTLGINDHIQAYEVKATQQFQLLNLESLPNYDLQYIHFFSDGGSYICI